MNDCGTMKYGDDTLLLMVDVQAGFINMHTSSVLPAIESILNDYKYIAATRFDGADGYRHYKQLLQWDSFSRKDPEWQMAVKVPERTIFFDKSGYNGFTDLLKRFVDNYAIKNIHLCGMDTDACVMATAFAIFDAGLRPVILSQLCASGGGSSIHQAALDIFHRNFGFDQVI